MGGLLASYLCGVQTRGRCARCLQLISSLIRVLAAKGCPRLAKIGSHPACPSFLVFCCFLLTWEQAGMFGEQGLVLSGATGLGSLCPQEAGAATGPGAAGSPERAVQDPLLAVSRRGR